MSRSIRLLNLSVGVSESRLRRALSQVGKISGLRIESARPGAATTTAVVDLPSELEATLVALVLDGRTLGGRILECQRIEEAPKSELDLVAHPPD